MRLILLVERHMNPVPNELTVLQDYGSETVVYGSSPWCAAHGEALFLEGLPLDFFEWLSKHGPVWTTKNPMTGPWEHVGLKTKEDFLSKEGGR